MNGEESRDLREECREYVLPEGWELAELNDLGELKTGTTPSKSNKEYYNSNDIPFIKPKNIQNSYVKTCCEYLSNKAEEVSRIVEKDSLLVTCIGKSTFWNEIWWRKS